MRKSKPTGSGSSQQSGTPGPNTGPGTFRSGRRGQPGTGELPASNSPGNSAAGPVGSTPSPVNPYRAGAPGYESQGTVTPVPPGTPGSTP